jgi:hypothetical protein
MKSVHLNQIVLKEGWVVHGRKEGRQPVEEEGEVFQIEELSMRETRVSNEADRMFWEKT